MIVVDVDYRLGPLGQLDLPGLDGSAGDEAIADQEEALRWVHAAIAAFGGDPARVAIFGESAGGISVCDLLVAPGAAGLFDAAIDQSGPCTGASVVQPPAPAALTGSEAFAASVGCPPGLGQLDCLRQLPVAAMLEGPAEVAPGPIGAPWRPATGTATLPRSPDAALATVRVPVVFGSDANDGAPFTPEVASAGRLVAWLGETYGDEAAAVAAAYPVGPAGAQQTADDVTTDADFACPALDAARRVASGGGAVWGYEDDDLTQAEATHGAELGVLMPPPGRPAPRTPVDGYVVAAWTSMLTTSRPPATWPATRAGSSTVEVLAPPAPHPAAGRFNLHHCDLWAAVGSSIPGAAG